MINYDDDTHELYLITSLNLSNQIVGIALRNKEFSLHLPELNLTNFSG
ncbi:hypothetical protein NIES2098_35150 [Calothrix sp. NIES-2098]|nr:hypothetical protein NIES2098_35150 [Calothrix sp. NIES-2098]